MKEATATIDSYLSFKLGDELFAINVVKALEILEIPRITRVPKAPEYMRGVINLRGNVLPVIDARTRFGLPKVEKSVDTCIIVMEIAINGESVRLGAIVDSVQEVVQIDETNIQPPPRIGNKYRTEFLTGMGKIDNQFVMILDIDALFSAEELSLLKKQPGEKKVRRKEKKS